MLCPVLKYGSSVWDSHGVVFQEVYGLICLFVRQFKYHTYVRSFVRLSIPPRVIFFCIKVLYIGTVCSHVYYTLVKVSRCTRRCNMQIRNPVACDASKGSLMCNKPHFNCQIGVA